MQYTGPASVVASAATATKAVATTTTSKGVIRSLYRSLLQEAVKLDNATVSKVLLPIPRKLQMACGLSGPLYIPASVRYADLVKRAFRAHKPGETGGNPVMAFEALNMFRAHAKTVSGLLEAATREHDGLVKALSEANPSPEQYWAKPLLTPTSSATSMSSSSTSTAAAAAQAETKASDLRAPETTEQQQPQQQRKGDERRVKDVFSRKPADGGSDKGAGGSGSTKRSVSVILSSIEPRVGLALVAHPLSSAHVDRRVILLTEVTPSTSTGLVLDMFYTYPLSHGNPMFPEVFYGHEIYNGGYCHVDFTMPPIANVTVLHTLPPPSDGSGGGSSGNTSSSYNARWLSWALKNRVSPEHKAAPAKHHERLCKVILPGDPKTGTPALYMSKVEALPYLASLVPGQPRSNVRIYWGCMRWSTMQLANEIGNGHWIPVDISPRFFGAYPVIRGGPGGAKGSAPAGGGAGGGVDQGVVDTFPTEEMLRESKELRTKLLGADVVPPQVFPPDQPVCRREPLWDQIMLAIDGEYKQLVGAVNPFISSRQHAHQHHQQVAGTPPQLAEPAQTAAAAAGGSAAAAAAAAVAAGVVGGPVTDDIDDSEYQISSDVNAGEDDDDDIVVIDESTSARRPNDGDDDDSDNNE